jgi:RNA polymerase sigma factor (sigma-70 family)
VDVDANNDNELMKLVGRGQVEQLGVLFERHQVKLFNFFLRLTNHHAVSEDLVQEVFLRMLKYRKSFSAGRAFIPWMYQIARNVHHDAIKKSALEVTLSQQASAAFDELVCPGPTPDLHASQRQEISLVEHALAQLPVEKREVLILSRFQNLKCEEIARITNCDAGTVRVRIHRALQELRTMLSRAFGEQVL